MHEAFRKLPALNFGMTDCLAEHLRFPLDFSQVQPCLLICRSALLLEEPKTVDALCLASFLNPANLSSLFVFLILASARFVEYFKSSFCSFFLSIKNAFVSV